MQKLEIKLTEEEELTLEFRNFEYQGLQINFNQFLSSGYDFNEEHCNRIIEVLLSKYSLLQKCLITILENHGHKNISVKSFELYLIESTLNIFV